MDQVLHVCHGVHSELCLNVSHGCSYLNATHVCTCTTTVGPLWQQTCIYKSVNLFRGKHTHIKSIKKRLLAPSCKKYFVHFSWWPDALCRTSRRPSPAVMRQFKFCISGLNLIWNTRLGFNLCESSWYFESQGVWKNLQPVRGTAAPVTEAQSSN